jgi:hypothetical protein
MAPLPRSIGSATGVSQGATDEASFAVPVFAAGTRLAGGVYMIDKKRKPAIIG